MVGGRHEGATPAPLDERTHEAMLNGEGVLAELHKAVRRKRFIEDQTVYPPASERVERCKPAEQPWTVSFSATAALAYAEKTNAMFRRGSVLGGLIEASGGLRAADVVAVLKTQLWIPPLTAMLVAADDPMLSAYLAVDDFAASCELAERALHLGQHFIILPSAVLFNSVPSTIAYNVHALVGRNGQPRLTDLPEVSSYSLTTYYPSP